MHATKKLLSGAAAVALASGLAVADLTGDEVTGAIVGGPGAFQVNPPTATVGDGIEFFVEFVGSPSHSVDIGAASVRIENVFGARISTGAGEVLVLGDLDSSQGAIIGIENFQTNEPEYTIDSVSFTANEIQFAMAPNIWEIDGFVSFDIVFEGGGGDCFFQTGCAADVDGDGDADVNDFFAYLDLFDAGDDCADVNEDGTVDVNDFFGYLDLFDIGC